MSTQSSLESQVAVLLVKTLNLEDTQPADIDPEENLFEGDMGLDSVDALELALAISQTYSVQLKAEDEGSKEAFQTLRSLTQFIENNRSA